MTHDRTKPYGVVCFTGWSPLHYAVVDLRTEQEVDYLDGGSRLVSRSVNAEGNVEDGVGYEVVRARYATSAEAWMAVERSRRTWTELDAEVEKLVDEKKRIERALELAVSARNAKSREALTLEPS